MNELEGRISELRAKWDQQESAVKIAVIAVAAIVALILIIKILPAIVAVFGIGLLLVVLFVPYWLPTIIAFVRKQPNKVSILVLNLLLGWTFIGWVVSLVWALSDGAARNQTIIVHAGAAPGAVGAMPPHQHQVGDVVNGHRFNGTSWVALQTSPAAAEHTPPPPPQTVRPDQANG